MSRIVVKVGSNVLTRPDGYPDVTMISSLVDQIVELRALGHEVVLVTSGAVACGRRLLSDVKVSDEVESRQLYSAMGQVRLMDLYFGLFRDHGYSVGQVLTVKENFAAGRERQNLQTCMEVMLRNGVIPIVNENDTVCITELMFTDNDELSSLVAELLHADRLVILSNVDGIFDGDPSLPGAKVLPVVRPADTLDGVVVTAKSSLGRGGMQSKCASARYAVAAGVPVYIACGRRPGVLVDLMVRPSEVIHTEFVVQ